MPILRLQVDQRPFTFVPGNTEQFNAQYIVSPHNSLLSKISLGLRDRQGMQRGKKS